MDVLDRVSEVNLLYELLSDATGFAIATNQLAAIRQNFRIIKQRAR